MLKPHTHFERFGYVKTSRVILRPLVDQDAPLVAGWRQDPANGQWFIGAQPSVSDQLKWQQTTRWNRTDFAIVPVGDDEPIGTVNFVAINAQNKSAEAGKLIGSHRHRGQGLGKEAFAAWLVFGFTRLNLHSVCVTTHQDNMINIKLNRSLGFATSNWASCSHRNFERNSFIHMTLDLDTARQVDYLPMKEALLVGESGESRLAI